MVCEHARTISQSIYSLLNAAESEQLTESSAQPLAPEHQNVPLVPLHTRSSKLLSELDYCNDIPYKSNLLFINYTPCVWLRNRFPQASKFNRLPVHRKAVAGIAQKGMIRKNRKN